MMKALFCMEPGQFAYQDIAATTAAEGQALLRVRRIGICGTDLHAYEGTQPFFNYPRVLGHELALEVIEAPGFTPGEQVTIIPYFNCGTCIACKNGKPNCCVRMQVFGVHIDGGMKEVVAVPADKVLHGQNLSLDELALVEPLAIGAHGLRRAALTSGEFVLVVGAGPIGLGIIALAQLAGGRVIVVDVNEDRLEFCRERLGVQHTVHAKEDVVQRLADITNNDMPTVVMDATGNLGAINTAFQYLAHGGRYVLVGLQKENISFSHPEFHKREATLLSSRNATTADFEWVIENMRNKKLDPAVFITHRTHFDEVGNMFAEWLKPANKVIKAMVEL